MDNALAKSKSFNAMNWSEKAAFCAKLGFFFLTFGFAFPTLLSN